MKNALTLCSDIVVAPLDGRTLLCGAVVVLWAVALCYFDLRSNTLPDSLTLPAGVGAVLAAFHSNPLSCWGGVLWAGSYLLVALVMASVRVFWDTESVGGGDIKLAVPLGIGVCAAGGVWAVICAMALAQIMMLLYALLYRSAQRSTSEPERSATVPPLPHGPAMILSALLSILVCAGG